MSRKNILTVVLTIVLMIGMVGGTIYLVKRHNASKAVVTTVTQTAEISTAGSAYPVDLVKEKRLLREGIFTDEFKTLTGNSYSTSSQASKEAYWKGAFSDDGTYNCLFLAELSTDFLNDPVKPSQLRDEINETTGQLNARGIAVLKAAKEYVFDAKTQITTKELGKDASKMYNSYPSKDNKNGIRYADTIGISGNTACWVIIREVDIDVDAQFDNVMSSKDGKSTTKAETTKKVVQLVRCGNTVTPTKPTPTPTTTRQQTTRQQTTRQQTTRQQTTRQQTTRSTTKPVIPTFTVPTTKAKDEKNEPVNNGTDQQYGGGWKPSSTDGTSSFQYEKPTKATTTTTMRSTTTTTTRQSTTTTTRQSTTTTTRPQQTAPTTQPPTAKPTQKPSQKYKDDKGNTTVIYADDEELLGDW